jgi:L,D-peptidoglycan transpeptidase YkuD (ErfK/YbiS/YcfS/YnhG family)
MIGFRITTARASNVNDREPARVHRRLAASRGAAADGRLCCGTRARSAGDLVRAVRAIAWIVLCAGLGRLTGGPVVTRIVVSKSQGVLTAYGADGRVLRSFPAIVGRQASGTKIREGDERTPEGAYTVCFKNPQSRFHLSLGLSYPNVADAERGLREGSITQLEYRQIREAHDAGRVPPWKTALGGEIFIHGGMEDREGTAGCVSISDEAIEELFPQIALGTPVVIEP